jgi:hypothetical protein
MIRPDRLARAIAADFWQAIADACAWLDERLADSCNGPEDAS